MTQFLLVEAFVHPFVGDLLARPVASTDLLPAATWLFGGPQHVWKISAASEEFDATVHESRVYVTTPGRSFSDTSLAQLLSRLIEDGHRFALFWSMDWLDLPSPDSAEELLRIVEEQLTSTEGNWELYARWGRFQGAPESGA